MNPLSRIALCVVVAPLALWLAAGCARETVATP
jgi:hypothetical protein